MTPLVFIPTHLGEPLRFCLKQVRFVDPERPVLVLTEERGFKEEDVLLLSPGKLGLAMPTPPLKPEDVIQLLAAYILMNDLPACWYLAEDTLLFDTLSFPEGYLQDVDIAVSQARDGTIKALYAKASALEKLAGLEPPLPNLEAAANVLDLVYEPLSDVRMGHTFCAGMEEIEGFRKAEKSGLKHVVWVGGQPFFVQRGSGLVARAITLHLPGALGRRLHRFYTGPGMLLEKLKAEGRLLF